MTLRNSDLFQRRERVISDVMRVEQEEVKSQVKSTSRLMLEMLRTTRYFKLQTNGLFMLDRDVPQYNKSLLLGYNHKEGAQWK